MNKLYIINKFKRLNPTLLKLSYFNLYNKEINNSNMVKQSIFLKNELLIRLSHNIFNLINLPYGLPEKKNIYNEINSHIYSFDKIYSFKKINNDNNDIFVNLLNNVKQRNSNLEYNISESLIDLNNLNYSNLINLQKMNYKLDTIFLLNISIKTLIEQHNYMYTYKKSIINNCNINNIITNVCNDVNCISNRIYNKSVNFRILNNTDVHIKYINYHIYYIINEIIKNSSISHLVNNVDDYINITIFNGNEDVIIKISDLGKGFLRSDINKIFTYSYSTYKDNITDEYEILNIPIISGLGFGLPLSRIYARYYGGDLCIVPIEKIGTDVYIYLNKFQNTEQIL